jgi:sugar phosphate isomerase/epimerase
MGKGCIDFPAIVKLGKEMGCTWYTIEYEAEGPQLLGDIEESIRYLRSIT